METFHNVVGHRSDADLADLLSELEQAGRLVKLRVPTKELGRRRFKAFDQHGVEYGVALPREAVLRNGSVLKFEADGAVLIEAEDEETLVLRATSVEGGIQLGWHAGHLHWRVRNFGDRLVVLLDAPPSDYLSRIDEWLQNGSIEVQKDESRN